MTTETTATGTPVTGTPVTGTPAAPGAATAPDRRVFVHIGAPKTGTTFLQNLLLEHRAALREEAGVLFPADTEDDHFYAAVDLQDGMFHGSYLASSRGHWSPVAQAAREWTGTSVISHEALAAATAEHARKAVEDLAPAEVHVVYTARDLGRQLTSRWQEDVKHGMSDTFGEWWAAVLDRDETHHYARWFWRTDDPTDVLSRWGRAVGPKRFHLVTVPPDGSRGELWSRFARLIGLDPTLVDADRAEPANTGLGVPEAELMRRVNAGIHGVFPAGAYDYAVKGALAHEILGRRRRSRRLTLPPQAFPVVERIARDWTAHLLDQGVDVVGDLDELLPHPPSSVEGHPSSATEEEVAEVAAWALGELLVRLHETDRSGRHDVMLLRQVVRRLKERERRLWAEERRLREENELLRRSMALEPVRTALKARRAVGRLRTLHRQLRTRQS